MTDEGSIYLRGKTWWVSFYVDGKKQRESAHTSDQQKAEKYLLGRLKKKHAHDEDPTKPFITQHHRRLTITDLLTRLEKDFRIRGKDSAPNRSHIKRAKADLGHFRATELTADDIDTYIDGRLNPSDGSLPDAKASINRVLEMISQAYVLERLPAPVMRNLSEKGNERKGFFSEQQIREVIAHLPADLADFTLFGWLTGMREGEIEALTWEDVDGDVIRLAAIDSKEKEPRLIPFEGELAELFKRRQAARRVEVNSTALLASLFFHGAGQPIGDFRKSWATACCAVGVGKLVCRKCLADAIPGGECSGCSHIVKREDLKYVGRTFHDLRRSACRNMINAGVPQKTAMAISGHRTDSMFRRYAISNENDLRTALRQTQDYLRSSAGEKTVITMPSERAQSGHNQAAVAKRG
ncbi:MAG TPA: site-specific integrase [Terriglobales bacterium]|nr:site-specific integrase [Terriglobales bacterium]